MGHPLRGRRVWAEVYHPCPESPSLLPLGRKQSPLSLDQFIGGEIIKNINRAPCAPRASIYIPIPLLFHNISAFCIRDSKSRGEGKREEEREKKESLSPSPIHIFTIYIIPSSHSYFWQLTPFLLTSHPIQV